MKSFKKIDSNIIDRFDDYLDDEITYGPERYMYCRALKPLISFVDQLCNELDEDTIVKACDMFADKLDELVEHELVHRVLNPETELETDQEYWARFYFMIIVRNLMAVYNDLIRLDEVVNSWSDK